jgi:hypothetical protein
VHTDPESGACHDPSGECRACPTETISSGSLPDVLTRAAQLEGDITPRPVPDVRVSMSHTPRCNRIHDGYWDIPPDDPSMVALFRPPPAS